jgi:uridine kinase
MDIKLKLLEGDTSKTYKINESAMLEVFSYPCELSSKGTGAIHPMLKVFVETMRKRYNTKTKNIDIIFLKSYQTLANTVNKYEDVFQFKNDFMVRVKDTIYIVDPVIFTNRNSSTRYYAGETETYYAVLRWQLCNILLSEYTDISNLRTINAISMYEAGINSDNYTLSSAQEKDLNKIKRIADINGYKSLPEIVSNRKSIVESAITEGRLIDKKDIYYNKQAFDDGRINLCFITGHSGSGKTTMAKNMPGDMVELDDVIHNYAFSDDNLREYCDLIYSFFNGVGKKYRVHSKDELIELLKSDDDYEEKITRDFIRYGISYANSHKDKKFVLEGIWIYLFIKPSELDNYAVYIKGTSAMKSSIRACNRDNDTTMGKLYQYFADNKRYRYGESKINAYRKYFEHKKSSI